MTIDAKYESILVQFTDMKCALNTKEKLAGVFSIKHLQVEVQVSPIPSGERW